MDKLDLLIAMRNSPWFFSWRWKMLEDPKLHRRVVRPGDDAVIEGFPRSANSFATHAFIQSQRQPVKVANHFHSPAQFVLAKRYNVPAMLVLREPRGAVLSYMLFHRAPAKEALRRYIEFHRPLLNIKQYFVVSKFEETTSQFGKSIDRLNNRFGTDFAIFDHSAENERNILKYIEDIRKVKELVIPDLAGDPMKQTTPSREKVVEREKLESVLDAPENIPHLAEARWLYSELCRDAI